VAASELVRTRTLTPVCANATSAAVRGSGNENRETRGRLCAHAAPSPVHVPAALAIPRARRLEELKGSSATMLPGAHPSGSQRRNCFRVRHL
jgi:hypothetical protein